MAKEKYKDKKTLRTYRFSDNTLAKLDELSEKSGLPRTGVLEQLIHLAEIDDEQQGEGEEGGETVA
jgi:predicted transcriptional regulator